MERDERIRQRAHRIWQQAGCPEGRDQEHWERAMRELDAETGGDPAASEPMQPVDQTSPAAPIDRITEDQATEVTPPRRRKRTPKPS